MLRNYLKIAIRNLRKQKLYALINIFGLALGIACCVLIYLFVRHELSYDRFHDDAERIFRVNHVRYESAAAPLKPRPFLDTRAPEGVNKSANLPLHLGPTLKQRYPEVERFVRLDESRALLRNGTVVLQEPVLYTDPAFLEMLSFDLLQGDAGTALAEKQSVVVTPEVARKYFGEAPALGQTLHIKIRREERPFTVTGVVEAPPTNSSLQFQVLLPIENKPFYQHHIERWNSFNTILFLKLAPGSDRQEVEQKLQAFVAERYGELMAKHRLNYNLPDAMSSMAFTLTPLTGIHLDASVPWTGASNPLYSYILSGIAGLILLIACINYITLALTRASGRAREVGIRKVAGAQRRQVAWQFWGETQLLALVSLVAGVGLAELFLPAFNRLSGKALTLDYFLDAGFLLALLALASVTGLLAGSYPALILARFHPVQVLKTQANFKIKPRFTRALLVLQYGLSVFLIISSLIMYQQLAFVSEKNLGYDKEQVVIVPTHTGWSEAGTRLMQRFREQAQSHPGVVAVTGMSPAFTKGWNVYGFEVHGENKEAFIYAVDVQFVEALGIGLVAGRNFSAQHPTDITDAIVVNEALAREMGWQNPIGRRLPWKGETEPSRVIGVVQDFHFLSLEQSIAPLILHMDPAQGGIGNVVVKLRPGRIGETLADLQEIWNEVAPATPFDYWFLDEAVARQYEAYTRWLQIMGYATGFAIMIACLGLFGLAGLTAVNKTKEIGIRKVLGAGAGQIVVLLNKDIVKLILLSLLLAAPLSWYLMERWLADFAYRIAIGPGVFVISGLVALTIALLTVSVHAIRAALANPVEALRYE